MQRVFSISGRVRLGLGKGAYFMGQHGYRSQFIGKLGIDPYPGTLNVELSGSDAAVLDSIRKEKGILVSGFKEGGKSFGDVVCYMAEISGIRCALVMPRLSTHTDVAEIISSENLREKLGLSDGSNVTVSVTA